MFTIAKIPSDNHIRDLLDPAEPGLLDPVFAETLAALTVAVPSLPAIPVRGSDVIRYRIYGIGYLVLRTTRFEFVINLNELACSESAPSECDGEQPWREAFPPAPQSRGLTFG